MLGEEFLSNDIIGHEPVQPTPDPRSDEPFETFEDPRTEQAIIKEKLDQNETSLEKEAREEENDRNQEETCKDIINLSKFESKSLFFRVVDILRDQIKQDLCQVFVRINVPHSDVIKPTPLNNTFSKDGYAFIRKIQLHRFENNFISGIIL